MSGGNLIKCEMDNSEEASFYRTLCARYNLDQDNDGIPCESI